MAGVKYHYALDEHNRLVSIEQTHLERQKGRTYHCIGCGAGMVARLGKVRNWHFAHRADEDHCGTETYLHHLAKRLFKEKFEKESSFLIGFYRDIKCSDFGSCPFAKDEECHVLKLKTFDLKEFYDTCAEEKEVGDYIADLLLTNSSRPEQEPVLIEIQVFHESEAQKRDSGLRIIEIKIKTEEDITNLLSSSIVENPDSKYGRVRDVETIGFAKFYGFKKNSSVPEPLARRSIQRFYLFRSGKAFVTNMDEFKSCREVWTKDNGKAILEVSLDSFYLGEISPNEYGYAAARQNGIEVKTCLFYKYHRSGYKVGLGIHPLFCCLHKKYGTPENPDPQYARECGYYREDKARLEAIYNSMPSMVIASTYNSRKP